MRVGVIGAGPAGFYTIQSLLRHRDLQGKLRSIDLFESLPVPFGLVRYGVAPDHPEVKRVALHWSQLMERHRSMVRYFGNVHVNGGGLSLDALRRRYARDAGLFLCMGAQGGDRKLGILGEEQHMISARALIAWYNGHPDFSKHAFLGQSGGEVVIVGNGNVALDVARMLLRSPAELRHTDCNPAAIEAIEAFAARTVHIVGRRDAANASWTARELRELVTLAPDLDVVVHEAMRWNSDNPGTRPAPMSRSQQRALQALQHHARYAEGGSHVASRHPMKRSVHFWFGLTPLSLEGDADQRVQLLCAPNELSYGPDGHVQCRPLQDAQPVRLPATAGAAFRSIGYIVEAPHGVPFDSSRNCIPNASGRVLGLSDAVYVAGWLKHGPRGVIANSLVDAQETVDRFVRDLQHRNSGTVASDGPSKTAEPGIEILLERNGVAYVDWDGWLRIDAEEHRNGLLQGTDRRKILTRAEMLRIALDTSVPKTDTQFS
ncbi:hypothetical protein F1559_004389 [Cyanidiococcus yangmingshanensis]|uniref:NADPH:adrenodoxin oxidoreductase, mitochondrial n=1 Tax=Cyanidiococcus yangmingshanensis TaxID=2690220 RepID=A0A7J7IKC4_9RHOD|nr:hypothetical protein F1559_004389 [Cyanidiococcus yangmingshanensis]